jgi:Arc/MetJ-type ribon-helix-helix transcriptional regulator
MSDIILAPDLAEIVRRKVASGDYPDPDAVLRAALDLLDMRGILDPLPIDELRRQVRIGIDQLDRNQAVEGRAFLDGLREEYARRGAGQAP